jgi:hypothetical protein
MQQATIANRMISDLLVQTWTALPQRRVFIKKKDQESPAPYLTAYQSSIGRSRGNSF